MPSQKPYIKAYLTHEEHTLVERKAEKVSLSVSKFVVAACLELTVTPIVDQQAVLTLMSCKADLGRLGGASQALLG